MPVYNHHNALFCEAGCEKWFHIKCIGVTAKLFKMLGNSSEPWYCLYCYAPPFQQIADSDLFSLFENTSLIRYIYIQNIQKCIS